MPDQKPPIPSPEEFSAVKNESRRDALRLLNLGAVILSAIAFLFLLISPLGELNGDSTFLLVGVSGILFLLLSIAYVAMAKRFRAYNTAQSKADEQVEAERREKEKLQRRLRDTEQKLKTREDKIGRLNRQLEEGQQALTKAKQEVRQKSKAKSEFLSAISHELRTPMNAIMGMTHLLQQGDPRKDQLEQLEVLDFSAKSLLALITDVIDYTRIESGKVDTRVVAFNVRNLIEEVVNDFRFIADKNHIGLQTEVGQEIPEKIEGDPTHLSQILSNLLSNALKFTRQGEVRIAAKELNMEGQKCRLLFSVEDTGVGISQENHDRIFNKFTQEQSGNARNFGGAGLGLTICKKLVELQGGKIYLKSEKDIGSTFYVELSFDTPQADTHKGKFPKSLSRDFNGATVLLVEDNLVNQTIMQRFLDKWHLNILIAEDGKQALEKMEEEQVHLVLMDLQMPNMDGYEATRLIRSMENRQKAHTPVIALTAASLQEVKDKALSAGMDDFLTKPFDPERLQQTLEHFIMADV